MLFFSLYPFADFELGDGLTLAVASVTLTLFRVQDICGG